MSDDKEWWGCKYTDGGLLQEGLGVEAGSVRHQQLCDMHLKKQQQQPLFSKRTCAYLVPASCLFTSPDPSTLQHEAAAIRLNLSGPCGPHPPAAARQPGCSRLLQRCGAERVTEKKMMVHFQNSEAVDYLSIMIKTQNDALNLGGSTIRKEMQKLTLNI